MYLIFCVAFIDIYSRRFSDLSGTEPIQLFHGAKKVESKLAVGRFARYATISKSLDPITEIESTVNNSLLLKKNIEYEQLQTGIKVINYEETVNDKNKNSATKIASNRLGTKTVNSFSMESARKRARDEAFGSEGDCPVTSCIRWDWKGDTSVAYDYMNKLKKNKSSSETHKFKCRLTLQGTDVFGGFRKMIELGLMEANLPSYVQDAPTLLQGGDIIDVNHGVISVKSVVSTTKK